MEIPALYDLFLHSTGVTTDTRKVGKGQLFFALKGNNFNGNAFTGAALNAGAAYAVIDEEQFACGEKTILVKSVLQTLQQLALYHKNKVRPQAVIAITGSNGKTTTKELIHSVLATTFQTHYTKGNLNNHIGIPLTLLEMPAGTELAVIEMGANHRHEIEKYCLYTEPTHGIITNCGKAHLEGFGGMEGIRKGKGELYDYLKTHQGVVFVNGDDAVLSDMLLERSITNAISYGHHKQNKYHSAILKVQPFLELQFEDVIISTQLFGDYNYTNILGAIAVGKYFGVSNASIKRAIEAYTPANCRSQVVRRNGYTLILDAYNANPTSMSHALESFAKSSASRKVVILGDMFELGDFSAEEHQKIADLCSTFHFDTIVLVGNAFAQTQTAAAVLKFPDAMSAQKWMKHQNLEGSTILLKGSRSMQMEKVVE